VKKNRPLNNRPRPFVLLNLALSADGKIATANRAVHSFGSPRDLRHLYELRATADAVMCGARTVEISDATLGNGGEKFRRLRVQNGRAEFPLRILVSGSGSLDPAARIFQEEFSPILLLTTRRAPPQKLRRLRALVQEIRICGAGEIDFAAALGWLRERWQVQRLLCEGGGELNDALFRAGLVDELHLTICPAVFGGSHAPTIADGEGFSRLTEAIPLKISSFRRNGDEAFAVFKRGATAK
jgi:riboflavin-specific deaminase-like protein